MSNRRRIFALSGLLCLFATASLAQSYVESALLFSRTRPGGSARIQGMGGSQIALGGDFSSNLSNPAGLGMYNRSEVTFTPALSFYNTRAQYLGNVDDDSKSTFNIPGLSFVFHLPKEKNGFLGGSFGISMTRINDFNRSISYHGTNDESSIIDYFIDDAFGSTTDQFDEFTGHQYNTPTGLAYFNYLIGPASIIDPTYPDDEYFTDVSTIPDQSEVLETKGSSNQWSFSYGGNFKDILFFGGGIGVTSLRYEVLKNYTEEFDDPFLNDLGLQESLEVRGTGVNATVGAIVRPVDFVQLGVSFTTPTYYGLAETYSATMNTDWKNFDYYGDGSEILNNEEASTDIVQSDYSLTTPLKFSGGIALLSKYGILTGDVEFTNPGQAKYSSETPDVSFQQENETIKSVFKSVVNYRVGAEFRYEIYRVRGGYAVQGSTYEDSFNLDNSIKTISGGLGVRMKRFFVDVAYVNSSGNSYYQPYTFFDGSGPVVDLDNETNTWLLTAGFTF
jgi:hypothetical protein